MDENAQLRRRLDHLWSALSELFAPLAPEMEADGRSDDHPEAEPGAENTERLHRARVQPRYHGAWRNVASVVSLIGSAMFGASFNFLGHDKEKGTFFAVAGFGVAFMLAGVWATFRHDALEEAARQRDERERRLQKVVDAYLRITEAQDAASTNDGQRASYLLRAGITSLDSDAEILEALTRLENHGRRFPTLPATKLKWLFNTLADENPALYTDLDWVNFVLRHADHVFPGGTLSTYD